MIEYKCFDSKELSRIKMIYQGEEWQTYLKDDKKLSRAFDNSLFVYGAFKDGSLIGFIRVIGDGEHAVFVQDLIVMKEYQRQGIGTYLFKHVLNKYSNVRFFAVITDINDKVDNDFYKSFGLVPINNGDMIAYFRKK